MKLKNLLVNGLRYPYGIDSKPVFSWHISADGYGSAQSAYRVIVSSTRASAEQLRGDLWDSGRVESTDPYDVVYQGTPLTSKTDYFWRVQLWDEQGESLGWSEVARFTTGIFTQDEWQGCWIGAGEHLEHLSRRAPMLRKTFAITGEVAAARLFICGLGLFEAKINGQRPDDSVLNPGHSQYTETVLYRAFDVTGLLQNGTNAIGVELGNSFYNDHTGVWNWQDARWRDDPRLIANLDIVYADGRRETVVTDESWKLWVNGPTVENSIYLGDVYDANLALDGWTCPGFDDSAWLCAVPVHAPLGKLACLTMPPVRRLGTYAPAAIENIAPGSWVITAPEMLSGWASVRMKAAKGSTITVTYAETRTADGRVLMTGRGQNECGDWWPEGYIQQDRYISDGVERFWEPQYSYKGYRYIQVDGYEGELTVDDVVLYCLGNEVDVISEFTCSDPAVEGLHRIMRRTLRNNFLWKPTDTPVWEKNGWLGDANVSTPSMFYEYDMRNFMRGFIDIMRDCQHEFGTIPSMIPNANWGAESRPVWNTIFVFATETIYDYYGELETVRKLYPELKFYANTVIDEIRGNGWLYGDTFFADWLAPSGGVTNPNPGNPPEGSAICGSAFIYRMLGSMERLAALTGHDEDIALYQDVRGKLYAAFQEKFCCPDEAQYDTRYWNDEQGFFTRYRQASNLAALRAGLVPEDLIAPVAARLVQDVREKGNHLDTGCVGTQLILPLLTDHGYADVAWDVLKQETYPGWGFWLANDPDTVGGAWESWERTTRSRDHYFMGTCDEFFYSHLAGVRRVKDGCKHVTIEPVFLPALDHAGASLQTVRGTLESAWCREADGRIRLNVQVPCGTTAQIRLRACKVEVAAGSEGILGRENGDCTVLTAVSGAYTFLIG